MVERHIVNKMVFFHPILRSKCRKQDYFHSKAEWKASKFQKGFDSKVSIVDNQKQHGE